MKRVLLLCVLISSFVISCKRDPLYYENKNTATVRVNINWSGCKLDPNGTTTFVFDRNTGKPACKRIISSITDYVDISLPAGEYYVLVVNETEEELNNIEFDGIDNFDNFSVRICTNTKSKFKSFSTKDNGIYAEDCDVIAVAEVENLVITKDDIEYYLREPQDTKDEHLKLINVAAERLTEKVVISLTIHNISSAYGAPKGRFTNLSGGYLFKDKVKLNELVNHEFSLTKKTKVKNASDVAIIYKEIVTFGPHFTKSTYTNEHLLQLNFYLTNGSTYYKEIEAHNIMETFNDGIRNIHNVRDTITLPISIGNGEGTFASEIEEWEDIDVFLPIE